MKETTATNTVYEIGTDRFFGPIRVEKTSGNETSVVLSIDPEEPITMNREEFSQVCEAVNKLMGWESEAGPATPKLVLVYGEVCNSGKAGTVAQSEMNSEEFADCEGDEDRLADAFGDCWVLDRASARAMAVSTASGGHGTFIRKVGKNVLEHLNATAISKGEASGYEGQDYLTALSEGEDLKG